MNTSRIKLPEWWPHALLPLEELLWRRRSIREFARRPLYLQQVAQLLWAAQGVSDQGGLRTTRKYGERGIRYVYMEAGHAAQNICLECTALGLATVPMGAFRDGAVRRAVGLPAGAEPLYLLPIGHPAA
jgi:nitroreductase